MNSMTLRVWLVPFSLGIPEEHLSQMIDLRAPEYGIFSEQVRTPGDPRGVFRNGYDAYRNPLSYMGEGKTLAKLKPFLPNVLTFEDTWVSEGDEDLIDVFARLNEQTRWAAIEGIKNIHVLFEADASGAMSWLRMALPDRIWAPSREE